MKRVVSFLLLAGLTTGCAGEAPVGPEALDGVAVQQSRQPKEYWLADFFTPLVPGFYGLRT